MSEPETGGPPARTRDMYWTAYQEGQRALDDQRDEIYQIRQHAVWATALGGAAFLATGVLVHPIRHGPRFYALIGLTVLMFVPLMLLLLKVCKPSPNRLWHYRLSATVLITRSIETDPAPTDEQFLAALAGQYDTMRAANETLLAGMRKSYVTLLIMALSQVALLIAAAFTVN